VPAADIGSTGPYGVYHSAFDNFNWFKKFGDPEFLYEQEMARVFGLETIRIADADVLPYDYEEYGKEIVVYLDAAQKKAEAEFGGDALNFSTVIKAAQRFQQIGGKSLTRQNNPPSDPLKLNNALLQTERALLLPDGLPNRPWFRHSIYAPGVYTGYAAVVVPGINEAIDAHDLPRAHAQIDSLAEALSRATKTLENYR
jgi:N-acetylated-alpha-linked acidic dipeptidase